MDGGDALARTIVQDGCDSAGGRSRDTEGHRGRRGERDETPAEVAERGLRKPPTSCGRRQSAGTTSTMTGVTTSPNSRMITSYVPVALMASPSTTA